MVENFKKLNFFGLWMEMNSYYIFLKRASLVAQWVKCMPLMWETQVRFPGWEVPLEKEMASHSSTLAWKVSRMEEPGRLQSMGLQTVAHD